MPKWNIKKRPLVILVGIIIIIAIAMSVAIYINGVRNADKAHNAKTVIDASGVPIADPVGNQAFQDAAKGDITKATAVYDQRIKDATGAKDKATQNLQAASGLVSDGNVPDDQKKLALQYALEAEKLYPSPESAAQLAAIYQFMGDANNTSKYYQLVEDRGSQVDAGKNEN